jgi:hypothetical protein
LADERPRTGLLGAVVAIKLEHLADLEIFFTETARVLNQAAACASSVHG